MRRAGHIEWRSQRRRHRPVCAGLIESPQDQRALAFRSRHHLQRHFRHDREGAPGSRQKFAQIVAGDVLHHPPSGFEAVTETGHAVRTQQMIAGATGLDAPGTGKARPDHAADRCLVRGAQQRRGVDRLERKLLIPGIDQRLHVSHRRAGLHRDDQLVGFVGCHCIERRQIEQRIGSHGLADQPLRAVTDDFQRLLAGDRRSHGVFHILCITNFESIHAVLLKTAEVQGRRACQHGRACGRVRRSDEASETPSQGSASPAHRTHISAAAAG